MAINNNNQISKGSNLFLNIIFIFYSIICVIPFIIVVSVSFSSESRILMEGFGILPRGFTTSAYEYVFKGGKKLLDAYILTIINTLVGTILSLIVISWFAYAISRSYLRYRKFFTYYIVIIMLFSGGLVPWYIVNSQFLKITNTYYALFLPYLFNVWHVIIMRTFYKTTIHDSIIESAKIDGAGEFSIFFKIVTPLAKAGYATIGLFTSLIFWNDWWLSLILTTDSKYNTLQYYAYRVLAEAQIVNQMINEMGSEIASAFVKTLPSETAKFAICVIVIIPMLFAYPFFQKYFVKGMTIGAIKG